MGSLLGVAVTKGAIYAALPADGVAVINADDAYGRWFEQHFISTPARCRVLRYGLEHSADVTARDIRAGAQGSQFTWSHRPAKPAWCWACRVATTSAMRWPPPARRWPRVSIWR